MSAGGNVLKCGKCGERFLETQVKIWPHNLYGVMTQDRCCPKCNSKAIYIFQLANEINHTKGRYLLQGSYIDALKA